MSTTNLGPMVSLAQIERAVLDQLSQPPAGDSIAPRIVYYLADYERQNGLDAHTIPVPPGPSSYRGEIDFETLQAEWLPLIGVYVTPLEEATRFGDGSYAQQHELEVAAIVGDDSEDHARHIADAYGACIAAALLQDGLAGISCSNVVMTSAPKVEYLTPDTRQVAKSTATFVVTVEPIVNENDAPTTWPGDPYTPPDTGPTVETVDIEIELMDTSADLDDATFTGDDVIDVNLPL